MRTTAKEANTGLRPPGPRHRRCWLTWMLLLWLPLAGAACNGASRSAGDDGAGQASATEDNATADEEYPNLARVPGEAPRPTPESLRKELVRGLAADRANARYTGELLTAATAAPPPAPPPPAAQPQVEIFWETLRVLPEGDSPTVEDATVSEDATPAAGAAADPQTAADEAEEELQINWETERVEPTGKVTLAGQGKIEEELILAPPPELLAVVYFPPESSQVAASDRELLEEIVALYKERGGRLRLVGHSDSDAGTDDLVARRMLNLELSLERANAVATTLLDLGADKEELLVEAKADGEPAGEDIPVGGESRNRRVEIFLEH